MRINPKYFNVFLAIVAVIAAVIIALYTYSNLTGDERIFKERMMAQDSLQTVYWQSIENGDSLRIDDYRGNFVVLDFWTEHSNASIASQKELVKVKTQYSDTLTVLAAAVGHQKQEVLDYIGEHQYPFVFVAGSKHFSAFNVPAIPAQLVFEPDGNIHSIFIGYRSSAQYDSLRAIIE